MKNENEKKGLFARLTQNKKSKKSSCCGNYVIEEIQQENKEKKNETEKTKKASCCGSYELEEIPEENKDQKNEEVSPDDKGHSCCG